MARFVHSAADVLQAGVHAASLERNVAIPVRLAAKKEATPNPYRRIAAPKTFRAAKREKRAARSRRR